MTSEKAKINVIKKEILARLCYTELVYRRINKKVGIQLNPSQIEDFCFRTIKKAPPTLIKRHGKNFYITNSKTNVRITVNSNTFRVITADKILKNQSVKLDL